MTPRIRPSALFAALTAAVLALFLWTAFREVQATLWRSAGGRAQAAADQLAAAIANTAERRVDEIARAATDPAVRHSIVAPTALTRQAARRGLESLLKGGQDTLELWTSTGERVLQIGTELSARTSPTRAGLSMLQESHGTVFYEVVAEVQPRSGYLAIRSPFSAITTGDSVGRLVGDDAVISVGNRSDSVWTSLSGVPLVRPVNVAPTGISEYRDADKQERVAASARVHRTPWAVRVEFSRPVVLVPAVAFLKRMIVGAFFLIALAAALYLLSSRTTMQSMPQAHPEPPPQRAQAVEAIRGLAGGVAHDFNNLLTAILGYSNLLLDELGPGHPARHDLEEIRKAGEGAASLTRELLAFSRQQVLQPEILDVNDLFVRLESTLHRLVGDKIALRPHLTKALDLVNADPAQIEQVIRNLATNARDAMPSGGTLTVETGHADLDEAFVAQHPGASAGPHVTFSLSDTGPGIDAATQARIFEPFFTTKKGGRGTGLGLATVYGIVKQSGGYIEVQSEVGSGTTIRIYLPRLTPASVPRLRSPYTLGRQVPVHDVAASKQSSHECARAE